MGWALAAALAAAAPRQAAHYGGALTLVLLSTAGRPARFVSLRQAFSRPAELLARLCGAALAVERRGPRLPPTHGNIDLSAIIPSFRCALLLPPLSNAAGRHTTGPRRIPAVRKPVIRGSGAFHAANRSSSVTGDTSEGHFLTPTLRLVALRTAGPREALQIIIGRAAQLCRRARGARVSPTDGAAPGGDCRAKGSIG